MKERVSAGLVTGYVILTVLALVYIYPFVIAVSSSFKTDAEANADPMSLIPQTFTFAAYERLFTGTDLPLWAANSVFITVIVTIFRVFFDSLAGYALSRLKFRGRGTIFAIFIAVLLFRPQGLFGARG